MRSSEWDSLSHFLIKALVFRKCNSVVLEKFIDCEVNLLKQKLWNLHSTPSKLQEVLLRNGLKIRQPTDTEYESNKHFLRMPFFKKKTLVQKESVFLVPFEHTPELLSQKGVHITRGYSWILAEHIPAVFSNLFRLHLQKQHKQYSRDQQSNFRENDEIDRILSYMEELPAEFLKSKKRKLDVFLGAQSPIELRKEFVPPCISRITQNFSKGWKFFGRQTLGLFYKNLHLDEKESLEFVKNELMVFNNWSKEYNTSFQYLFSATKDYKMTSCATLQTRKLEVGGCAMRSLHECRAHLKTVTKMDHNFWNPVQYYREAEKSLAITIIPQKTVLPPSKLNPNFLLFSNSK